MCGILRMGISGLLSKLPGHLQHFRVQGEYMCAGVGCAGVCTYVYIYMMGKCVCVCVCVYVEKEVVLVSFRSVPSIYLGIELAWGKTLSSGLFGRSCRVPH